MSKNEVLNTNNDKKPDFSKELEEFNLLWKKVMSSFVCCEGKNEGSIDYRCTNKIIDFARKIEAKYPDYSKYVLYHKIYGGGEPNEHDTFEKCDKFDFPGEDSVFKFFSELEKNIKDDDIEKDRKETVELLKGSYPDYFQEENLIREGDKWCVMRLGKCLPISEWMRETEDDVAYHSADDKKDRYR